MIKIGVAIVTYNRINKLKKTLKSYSDQTFLPSFMVVFNNCSADGTSDLLESWKAKDEGFEKIVVNSSVNLGGSGGFYEAMSKSLEKDFDLLWISDDDAYPGPDSLKIISEYFINTSKNIGAICGTVIENGVINYEHRSIYPKHRIRYPFGKPSTPNDYENDEFDLDIFSYVGTAISRAALEKCGLTKKDYFIWCDDAEHSMRITKEFDIVCLPSIKIIHDVDEVNSTGLSWKSYYGIRNRFDAIRRNGNRMQLFYYRMRYFAKEITAFFTSRKRFELIRTAIYDYKHGNFGVSPKYKPGTKL